MEADQPDDQLADNLVASATGDRSAFRRVYEATAPRLFAICLHVTNDRSAAEDVLQIVYMKIWRSAAQFDPARARAKSWLDSIARNSAIDWYRAQRPTRSASDQSIATIGSGAEPVDDRIVRIERTNQAMSLVKDLDEDLGSQVCDIYLRGMTYAEIAELNGVPLGTLKSRIRRALIGIRAKMRDE